MANAEDEEASDPLSVTSGLLDRELRLQLAGVAVEGVPTGGRLDDERGGKSNIVREA